MTKNSAKTISRCLGALVSFDEVLVLDTGSTDDTLEIVSTFPTVKVLHQNGITNFGKTRNYLAEQASNDWIFMVDSDEICTPELVAEIKTLPDVPATIYGVLRINHYIDRPIRACAWYPDYNNRIYNRKRTKWKERIVHEILEIPQTLTCRRLKGEMNHFSVDGAAPLASKALWYAELFAKDNAGKRKSSLLKAISHGMWMFVRCYIFRTGFLYGRDGFTISFVSAYGSFMKYLLLSEENQKRDG
ncbi:MAG: glycosyltransferase family 2 protein [Planctomycetaceae bacterium]|jgi:glycosyltransferase involved in cell wall biosynthesis|nr:glycosyltransferase family 2 protein [Planctomycetaceae bacterium]